LSQAAGQAPGSARRRDAEKVAKVAKALEKGVSVAEIVPLTCNGHASVKRYRQQLASPQG
jgi:hypothetical protein